MKADLRRFLEDELSTARSAEASGDAVSAWAALERAHVLSQGDAGPHVRVHWHMIRYALRRRDVREIAGQIPRLLLAGPASLFGMAPRGNTGGTSVGIFVSLPVPEELQRKLDS